MPRMAKAKAKTRVVWVRWFDASYQPGECTDDDLVPRVVLESAGLLVREDADTVSFALDRYEGDRTWRHVAHIPRVNIIKIRRLTV